MQDGRSALTVYSAFCIFLVLSFSGAHGETLYRWTNAAGRPCYSNVSPPAGMKAFRIYTGFRRDSERLSVEPSSADTLTAGETPAKADNTYSGFSEAYLKQRIADRKRSIGHIETLLREHPNDPALRRSLFKKRQYLFEDRARLDIGRP